jgi:Protein of unknown function (DUF2752)
MRAVAAGTAPAGPLSRLAGPGAVAAVAAGGLALVHAVDPYRPGSYPVCPSLALTGLYCPGCGTLRMLHSLTDGDLAGALDMNPMALLLVPVLAGWWLAWTWRAARGRRPAARRRRVGLPRRARGLRRRPQRAPRCLAGARLTAFP